MAAMNKVILVGNVTRDPEGRRTNSGTSLCSFSIAVNRKYKRGDGERAEETTYVDCEAWGQPADFIRDYVNKGDSLLVDGRLKLDSWEDRNTGQKRSKLKVVAESVQSLTSRSSGTTQQQAARPAPQAPPPPPFPTGRQAPPPPQQPELPPNDRSFDPGDESISDIPF